MVERSSNPHFTPLVSKVAAPAKGILVADPPLVFCTSDGKDPVQEIDLFFRRLPQRWGTLINKENRT